MDLNQLFTNSGMRGFTAAQRDQHLEDARQYGQLADVVEQRLRSTTIDGDRLMAGQRRARKVAGKLRKMEKASKRAAGAAEALYAVYLNDVLELPGRREAAEAKRLERKDRRAQRKQVTAGQTAAWAAKSLHKSAAQLGGQVPVDSTVQVGAEAAEQAPVYLPPQPAPFAQAPAAEPAAPPSIADFFLRKEAR
ncbi:hypothetical protein ACIF6L_34290 [Kitasatospora sp. NPDC086009]|uniref:hypothetical protein n=1 Tax=unclassified Kitasatospora TaxID=2633591 RepID=UPI0037C667C4